jgi:hypothetical protein
MAHFRITTLTAWVCLDPENGDEGIIGMLTPEGWLPLVAADETRMRQCETVARKTAKDLGVSVRLVQFSVREDLLEIHPSGQPD